MSLLRRIRNVFTNEISLENERLNEDNYNLLLKNAELGATRLGTKLFYSPLSEIFIRDEKMQRLELRLLMKNKKEY